MKIIIEYCPQVFKTPELFKRKGWLEEMEGVMPTGRVEEGDRTWRMVLLLQFLYVFSIQVRLQFSLRKEVISHNLLDLLVMVGSCYYIIRGHVHLKSLTLKGRASDSPTNEHSVVGLDKLKRSLF